MSDKDYQLRHLARIFEDAAFSPVFKPNRKFSVSGSARIAYSDVMALKYVIREDKHSSADHFWNKEGDIVATYPTLEALVEDGWRLD